VFLALKIVGAGYLLYLGYRSWRADTAPIDLAAADGPVQVPSPLHLFRTGFLIGISNPKALLFAGAFLPQFIDPAQPKVLQFAILVVTFGMIEVSSYLLYALGGRSMAGVLMREGKALVQPGDRGDLCRVRAGDRGEPGLSCRM
jgi:threonine/homoserine/homoserine lactone efflux protein